MDMDKLPGQVCILGLIHPAVHPHKPPGGSRRHGRLDKAVVQDIYRVLGVGAQVHIPVAAVGVPLLGEQGIEDKGILAMVIQPPVPEPFLVLRGEQHRLPYILAVVQQIAHLVVHVHHRRLVRRGNGIVVDVPGDRRPGSGPQLVLQLRICRL